MAFSLSRNAKLYVSVEPAGDPDLMSSVDTWEIPVLDGFSFTQDTETQEVQISEAGDTPSRGQQVFNTAQAPVNWSFSNYMRPRWVSSTSADAVERVLWEAFAAPPGSPIDTDTDGSATTIGATGEGMAVDFLSSNVNELMTVTLLFKLGTIWYKITEAVVDTAEVDFSIESIATINWTGFGTALSEVTTPPAPWVGEAIENPISSSGEYITAPPSAACIRNKLTTFIITDNEGTPGFNGGSPATIAITGGSLTFANNIGYLTPENLGQLNQPCGHFTGSRTVNGELTAYLKSGSASDTASLIAELAGDTNQADPQDFNIELNVGGLAPATPFADPVVQIVMPHANLVVPVINVEDVLTTTISFSALPTDSAGAFDFDGTANEATITYFPDES